MAKTKLNFLDDPEGLLSDWILIDIYFALYAKMYHIYTIYFPQLSSLKTTEFFSLAFQNYSDWQHLEPNSSLNRNVLASMWANRKANTLEFIGTRTQVGGTLCVTSINRSIRNVSKKLFFFFQMTEKMQNLIMRQSNSNC